VDKQVFFLFLRTVGKLLDLIFKNLLILKICVNLRNLRIDNLVLISGYFWQPRYFALTLIEASAGGFLPQATCTALIIPEGTGQAVWEQFSRIAL
jgi:hypothetical protein